MAKTAEMPGDANLTATSTRTSRAGISVLALAAAALSTGMPSLVMLGSVVALCHAQSPNLTVTLPNPDGRDPVFDQSNAGRRVVIEFQDLEAATRRSLEDSAGSLRLINFWATWCTPCIRELPSLAALARQRAGTAFAVIPVSLDQKGAPGVPDFIAGLGVQGLEWFADPSAESGKAADVYVLPTTVIVDMEGNELGRLVGSADWTSAEAVGLIDAIFELTER